MLCELRLLDRIRHSLPLFIVVLCLPAVFVFPFDATGAELAPLVAHVVTCKRTPIYCVAGWVLGAPHTRTGATAGLSKCQYDGHCYREDRKSVV